MNQANSLLVRQASADDAQAIREIYRPYIEDSAISFEYVVPDIAEIEKRINLVSYFFPWLVLEEDGVVLGYAYGNKHRERLAYQWSVETSVYIDRGCHKKGFGKMLYQKLFEILRIQGFVNAYAGITMPNEPSVAFHKSFGFQYVGTYSNIGFKQGQWHDVSWWQKEITPALATLEDPVSIKSLPGIAGILPA